MNSIYLNDISIFMESHMKTSSIEELKEFLNDDEKIDQKIDDILKDLKMEKDTLFEENRSKAEQNIEKEPQIIELRAKVAELAEEGKQTCQAVQNHLSQIKEKLKVNGNDTTLALLQASAASSEEESEQFVTQFNNNELSIEAFLDAFLSKRITMHLRKLKAEKMQEILSRDLETTSVPPGIGRDNGIFHYPPIRNYYPTPPAPPLTGVASVPYPSQPNMPMPPVRPF